MRQVRIISWNVNGVRSVRGKGFLESLLAGGPDIVCLQETKIQPDQLDDYLKEPAAIPGLLGLSPAQGLWRRGHLFGRGSRLSVALRPRRVRTSTWKGRVIAAEYP